jgi:hypothetical protein
MNSLRYGHSSEKNIFKSNGPFRFICTHGSSECGNASQRTNLAPKTTNRTLVTDTTRSPQKIEYSLK